MDFVFSKEGWEGFVFCLARGDTTLRQIGIRYKGLSMSDSFVRMNDFVGQIHW